MRLRRGGTPLFALLLATSCETACSERRGHQEGPRGGQHAGESSRQGSPSGSAYTLTLPSTAASVPVVEAPAVACGDARAAGTTYHFCDCGAGAVPGCVPGRDEATGTTPLAPMQTYAKARRLFERMGAGDSIAFCRGGVFRAEGSRRWVNARCRNTSPCTVADYVPPWASSGLPDPVIDSPDGDAFSLRNGGAAEHEEGYVFRRLSLRGGGGEGKGFDVGNDVDDVTVCGVDIDGFRLGVHVAGSQAPPGAPETATDNRRFVLRGSRVRNNSEQGWLGGCNECVIEDNHFENNGFGRPILNHHIYLSGSQDSVVRGMRVAGNHLYKSANIGGVCRSTALVAHGAYAGLVITNNEVHEDALLGENCWGISVDTGYAREAEQFSGVVIAGNTVVNTGRVGIGLNGCSGCTVENNLVISELTGSVSGVVAPVRERGDDDQALDRAIVRNNTVLILRADSGVGVHVGGEGRGHVSANNLVVYLGSGKRFGCFRYDLDPIAYAAVDANVCHSPASGRTPWEKKIGELVKWQGKSGLDVHSRVVDPRLTRASAPFDLVPLEGSPILGMGLVGHAPKLDRAGRLRPQPPSIGAFERE